MSVETFSLLYLEWLEEQQAYREGSVNASQINGWTNGWVGK